MASAQGLAAPVRGALPREERELNDGRKQGTTSSAWPPGSDGRQLGIVSRCAGRELPQTFCVPPAVLQVKNVSNWPKSPGVFARRIRRA